ncbi:NADH-quinone oxidoreductase subunit NuoG [Granulosicoccus sp. 3-233]|uniref:NADH-quinone oxidoreductase subunit NuoG n=1 Tax=Granulosicoccus sp. 3-233 TaxID=3417969 RepID=UPI003D34DB7E
MSDDTIQITVDGTPLTAKRGQMLIEVTDAAGIDVPRFCYHKKLSVAANCRMCLVEVEKAPKPLPACATPCMPDMVVHTDSKLARDAQKGTMEFLLINHPLDCPICDQGGECELQDVAMGYGSGASQYTEGKRVVFDKYIGPLIATEMTRCIHCTRCVRFGEEIAGIRELGATGRGENVRIGTYIEKSVVSEVSGNVIDICPVGALTARPSRFTARAWELSQQSGVSPHDSVGSNIFIHMDGTTVNRVVPRDNESINEVWIADRDRFSYQGLNSAERLSTPLVRVDGQLQPTDWTTALAAAAARLKCDSLGVLASANNTLEELYLSQKLGRALGSRNIDHRLGQSDFSAQDAAPVMPWLGMGLNDLETLDAALLVGSNIRKDQPIAALRLRKSALKGAAISFINPRNFPLHFEAAENIATRFDRMVTELYAVARAAGADISAMQDVPEVQTDERHQRIAESLKSGERAAVFLGNMAVQHPDYAQLQYLANALSKATGATLSMLPERANTAGAWLAGAVPHREAGGRVVQDGNTGMNASQMLDEPLQSYLLVGVEPELDAANPARALKTLQACNGVVAISAYLSEGLSQVADVVLPAATFTETFGTYVNATGNWQSARGVTNPPGDARPAWKIFRVLASELEIDGFEYDSPEDITRELQSRCGGIQLGNLTEFATAPAFATMRDAELLRAGETPIYATDPVVRRSQPLQKSLDGKQAFASMADSVARKLSLADGDPVSVRQNGSAVTLPVKLDNNVPDGCVWVPTGLPETAALGELFGAIEVSKA